MSVLPGALLKIRNIAVVRREAARLEFEEIEMSDQETQWRAEFERLGEQQVYDNVKQGAI